MPRKPFLNSIWAPRALALMFGILLLGLVEGGLRWIAPVSRLDNILALLREDPELIWTQKPHLRADFFGTPVATDHLGLRNTDRHSRGEKASIRVLTLGASLTFGWGVAQKESYSAVLQELLRDRYGERVHVTNGGIIGYTTHQGLGFLKRNWGDLKPDIVSIAYVINDVDAYRFFRSDGRPDKELAPLGAFSTGARNFLKPFALFRTLEKVLRRFKKERVAGIDFTIHPGEIRVSRDDYESNLAEFAVWVRGKGADVLFLKMPVNLPTGGPPGANSLLGLEAQRCARDAVLYNESMLTVAANLNVAVVDVVAEFAKREDKYLFVDKEKDTIHPNAAGHEIIGTALFKKVDEMIGPRRPGRGRGPLEIGDDVF